MWKKIWVSIFKIHLESNHISTPHSHDACMSHSSLLLGLSQWPSIWSPFFYSCPHGLIIIHFNLTSYHFWLLSWNTDVLLYLDHIKHIPSSELLHLLFLLPVFLLYVWIGSLSHFLHIVFPNKSLSWLSNQKLTIPILFAFMISVFLTTVKYITYFTCLSCLFSDIRYLRAEIFFIYVCYSLMFSKCLE